MALYRWNTKVSWIGRVPWTEYMTQATYDALPSSKLTDNINRGIYTDSEDTTLEKFIKNWVEYCFSWGGGWWDNWPMVDVIVVAWWGGWGGWAYWLAWWGWGGWVKECKQYHLEWNSISVVVWSRGTLWSRNDYPTNWGDSCFWDIKACWWWNWCSYWKSASDWWNWWWWTVTYYIWSNRYTRPACWVDWWYEWWYNPWWGWWAWWPWNIAICGSYWWVWWIWYRSDIFCPWCLFSSWWSWWWSSTWQTVWHPWGWSCYHNWSSWGLWDATFYWWGWAWWWGSSCVAWTNWYQWVVMVRYPTDWSYWVCSSTWGNCCFTCDWYCYVEFTSDWTFTITW